MSVHLQHHILVKQGCAIRGQVDGHPLFGEFDTFSQSTAQVFQHGHRENSGYLVSARWKGLRNMGACVLEVGQKL